MTKRKILCLLESRATWGYSKNVLKAFADFPTLEFETLVTGSHLSARHGETYKEIEKDGFEINYKVSFETDDSKNGWSNSLGKAISEFSQVLEKSSPDFVLLFGDRVETFGMCVAAAYSGHAIAHVQAGDVSGHIDDAARHAIGKFCHLHLASCADSAERLIKMGEQSDRVFNVGAPQLDDIVLTDWKADFGYKNLQRNEYFLLLHHPVMYNEDLAKSEIEEIFKALKSEQKKILTVLPNSDRGHEKIIEAIYKNADDNTVIVPNLTRDEYLFALSNSCALVGNSSSGILEAPSFKVPVINVGNRQDKRPQASNIVNAEPNTNSISTALKVIKTEGFIKELKNTVNPYGNGGSSYKILSLMAKQVIDRNFLSKKITY